MSDVKSLVERLRHFRYYAHHAQESTLEAVTDLIEQQAARIAELEARTPIGWEYYEEGKLVKTYDSAEKAAHAKQMFGGVVRPIYEPSVAGQDFSQSERAFLGELEWCIAEGNCGQRTRDALKHARAILGAAPVADSARKCMCSGLGPCEKRTDGTCRVAIADSAMAKDAELLKMINDLEAEQTFISSCRERCDPDHELPRWDRIQAVIDHLKSQQRG